MKKTELKDVKKQKPLSAYVLELTEQGVYQMGNSLPTLIKIMEYARKFSKKPELGDFIPCEDGKPLEKPKAFNGSVTLDDEYEWNKREETYQAALSRVIYKGFELEGDYLSNGEIVIDIKYWLVDFHHLITSLEQLAEYELETN